MDKSLTVKPVVLAPHGTHARALVCTDDCVECAPRRAQLRAWKQAQLARERKVRVND